MTEDEPRGLDWPGWTEPCSDIHCVLRPKGHVGQGTNGGCRHLRERGPQMVAQIMAMGAEIVRLADLAERNYALAQHEKDIRCRHNAKEDEATALLDRIVRYVTEDRAVTPGVTRLARVTEEARHHLARMRA